ncbi:MAG: ribbon-helix-helix protein, CopG family [Acidobacteriota bacterium]
MVVQTVRLPDELASRLAGLAKVTKRSKSSFIIEALESYLTERQDLEIALARIRDPGGEWLDHEEVKRALNLD